MRGSWQTLVGILVCLASMSCRCGEPEVRPTPEVAPAPRPAQPPPAAAAPAAAGKPAEAPKGAGSPSGMNVRVHGEAGGVAFDFTCTGPGATIDAGPGAGQTTLTEAPPKTIITCLDSKTGFELTLNLVSPKVGRMDVSPNADASVIRLKAGAAGTPDSTDGGSNADMHITTWEAPGGHRVGTFSMNWLDDAGLKQKSGRLEGAFAM